MTDFGGVLEALRGRWEHVLEPDLTRITALLDALGEPQRSAPAVHVTGTNGKTSTVRMVDALLRAHDLRTGRITSPHLASPVERVAIDGEPVSEQLFAEVYDDIAPIVSLIDERVGRVTYFEVLTALAFAAFADAPVDAMVVEVGLGGTWDATNVLQAPVAVVTPISLDHTELLGDSVEAIAGEKAGIIHAGAVAVVGHQPPGALAVLRARCDEVGASLLAVEADGGVLSRRVALGGQQLVLRGLGGVSYDDVLLPLHGAHQADNAALALVAAGALLGADEGRALDAELVRQAFALVESPGRLEVVSREPTVLLDGAHNPAGVAALVRAVEEEFALTRVAVVLAVLADKDVTGILTGLRELDPALVVCTASDSPRALPAGELGAAAAAVGLPHEVATDLPQALARALEVVRGVTGAAVLVTGSLATVGQARGLLLGAGH